jgi:tungstate transport system ATP-binding protein
MSSLLHVEGLRKNFGERRLLDIPELKLECGHAYLLVGENGCGKTTLLRILAGLEPAEMARMQFLGAPLQRPHPDMVYLHQQPYLFHSSVTANIAYGLKVRGVKPNERALRIAEVMAWAGVSHLGKTPPHKLSGGEKQRVALARAKVLNPKLQLLDEPTANLDAEARSQVAGLLHDMCDANHCAVIATHDKELMRLENAVRLTLENGGLRIG